MRIIATIFFTLSLIGCTNSPSVQYESHTETKFQPTQEIQVFDVAPKDREYQELGQLKAGCLVTMKKSRWFHHKEDAYEAMKEKARQIGANAIYTRKVSKSRKGVTYYTTVAIRYVTPE